MIAGLKVQMSMIQIFTGQEGIWNGNSSVNNLQPNLIMLANIIDLDDNSD